MKRIYLATARGRIRRGARRGGRVRPAVQDRTERRRAKATTLPPLPANIKSRNRFIIGVKCDVPPFGYIDVQGKNAGFDVEVGRWFARYAFGRASSASRSCARRRRPREPLLTTDRVDLVISTFTYTADRDTRIDFSRAYYKAGGRLLVKNDGPVQKLSDLAGKKVATTSGSVYDRWMKNCFKSTEVIVADTFTNAMLAFNQGRADAVMYDDAVLLPVAAADRTAKLDRRLLPRGAVRHRHQAGQHGDEGVGRLAPRADEEEGSVPADPQDQRPGAVRDLVLEEHPAAEQHVRVRRRRRRRARTPFARSA